jgi:hypothetical protein
MRSWDNLNLKDFIIFALFASAQCEPIECEACQI